MIEHRMQSVGHRTWGSGRRTQIPGHRARVWVESQVLSAFPACPAAVPSPPYGITLLSCDGHCMTLGWKVPRFSGGAAILGYYLDVREAGHTCWHEVNSSPIKERLFVVRSVAPSSPMSQFPHILCAGGGKEGVPLPSLLCVYITWAGGGLDRRFCL